MACRGPGASLGVRARVRMQVLTPPQAAQATRVWPSRHHIRAWDPQHAREAV